MATVEKAEELLEKLRSASWKAGVQGKTIWKDLRISPKAKMFPKLDDLNHWDISFWSERAPRGPIRYHNEEELRPYFSLPKVMDGLFSLANKLFGIDIEPADGLAPVWNNDGGAWMDEVLARSRVLSRDWYLSKVACGTHGMQSIATSGRETQLDTFREVETVFHEFGHALQHMLTKQDEGLVAGIRGVEWDAVELPSQFMENWCYHRDTLMSIAKHYATGETLPEEVYLKLLAARTFRAGSLSLRQIRFASVDLKLHTDYIPGGSETIYDVDRRVSERTQVIPPLPEDRFLCGFSHIFGGGYAAGYYSYKWAEVLSADTFSAFEDAGLDNSQAVKETGHKFRETILALGGGKAP
ncbi:hypothetical protein M0R45_000793 [Rubus argutus]|uniref:Peptidase M3A/M3B catalytic domain-containing protein n=1 Tax=Rubus argutus TaxID=59490 RepID=A0AAW1VLT7_RUBAR